MKVFIVILRASSAITALNLAERFEPEPKLDKPCKAFGSIFSITF